VKEGNLEPDRLESYLKLRSEFESHQSRRSIQARVEKRREGKRFSRMVREVSRFNPKRKRR